MTACDEQGQPYAIRCSGCDFRFTGTLEQIGYQARMHDDSPQQQHIVLMDPPGLWPQA